MKKYITVSEFVENIVREAQNFRDWRIISIGHNSDGEYVFHIIDEYEHNREIHVSCWEGRN